MEGLDDRTLKLEQGVPNQPYDQHSEREDFLRNLQAQFSEEEHRLIQEWEDTRSHPPSVKSHAHEASARVAYNDALRLLQEERLSISPLGPSFVPLPSSSLPSSSLSSPATFTPPSASFLSSSPSPSVTLSEVSASSSSGHPLSFESLLSHAMVSLGFLFCCTGVSVMDAM